MDDMNIPATGSTPAISCTALPPRVYMRGDSYPENAFDFYQPVLQWIEAHLADADAELAVDLELVYLNTSSVRIVMDVFDSLEEAHRRGNRVQINWYYDARNERVAELAEEFKEDLSLPFNILPQA